MALITWPDQITGELFTAAEANEIKSVVNANDPTSHIASTSNPHSVTKAQVGLSDVDNTSDANKPVSTAQQTAIDAKVADNLTASTTVAPSKTAVNTALALKQNTLTIDTTPTNGSTNPVQSNGVFDVITGVYSDMALKLAILDLIWNEIPTGTINGSNDTFTLANTPVAGKALIASDGVVLTPTADYSISGTTLTIVIPPSSALLAFYLK